MDKSFKTEKLVDFAKAWQEEKKTRSIVILAIERDDDADAADVSNLVSGNVRDMLVMLAELINENPEIFKPAIKLAEIMKEKEKKVKDKKIS